MLFNLADLIKKYNIKIKGVIHIGGHFGQELSSYQKNGIKNIIFFEPVKENFNILRGRINGVAECYNLAVGNKNGKVNMYVDESNEGQSSSVLKPKKHLIQYPEIKFKSSMEAVTMVRLDSFFDNTEHKKSDFNFINIDIQGYELEAFKGATGTLTNIDYIYTEVNRDELYENCVQVDELDIFLLKYGFERVETTWDGQTWGDALYIKKNLLSS